MQLRSGRKKPGQLEHGPRELDMAGSDGGSQPWMRRPAPDIRGALERQLSSGPNVGIVYGLNSRHGRPPPAGRQLSSDARRMSYDPSMFEERREIEPEEEAEPHLDRWVTDAAELRQPPRRLSSVYRGQQVGAGQAGRQAVLLPCQISIYGLNNYVVVLQLQR